MLLAQSIFDLFSLNVTKLLFFEYPKCFHVLFRATTMCVIVSELLQSAWGLETYICFTFKSEWKIFVSENSLNYDWIFKLPVLWRDIILLKYDVLVFSLRAHSIFNEN